MPGSHPRCQGHLWVLKWIKWSSWALARKREISWFMLLHCTIEGIFRRCMQTYFETFVAGAILYISRPAWHIVYCEGVKRGQGKSKWARTLSYVSQAPPHPPHPTSAFSKQDHYEDTMQWKYGATEDKSCLRTKAKCAYHSLTQSSPCFLDPKPGSRDQILNK